MGFENIWYGFTRGKSVVEILSYFGRYVTSYRNSSFSELKEFREEVEEDEESAINLELEAGFRINQLI